VATPEPKRPKSFSLSLAPDWTGGMYAAVMDGSGVDYVWATSACKTIPIEPSSTSNECVMTDELNSSLAPREDSEFLKMRVVAEFVDKKIDIPSAEGFIPLVSDCFILLDIIGAPGTYAIRLKNENSSEFSPWIAVGQPQSITNTDASLYFMPRFTAKDQFELPWILSPGSGRKGVTAEVLTFAGKSQPMQLAIEAEYELPKYSVDVKISVLDVDAEDSAVALTMSPPSFNGYPIISNQIIRMPDNTAATMSDIDALEVGKRADVQNIQVFFTFEKPARMSRIKNLVEKGLMSSVSENSKFEAVLVTRGVEKFVSSLSQVDENRGIWKAEFSPIFADGILARDGIAAFYPSIPSECIQGSLVDLSIEGVDFAGLGDNAQKIEIQEASVYRGFSDPSDRRNAFGDASYWRQQ
jgi:hypothetical protein